MTIKHIDFAYLDEILALQKICFPDGWNREMFLSAKNDKGFKIYGVFDEEKLVGAVYLGSSYEQADIHGVFIIPEYRKRGLASILIKYAVLMLIPDGVEKVFLEVRESNEVAINLYKKLQFSKLAERKKYYPDGETAIVFIKRLV